MKLKRRQVNGKIGGIGRLKDIILSSIHTTQSKVQIQCYTHHMPIAILQKQKKIIKTQTGPQKTQNSQNDLNKEEQIQKPNIC